MNPIAFEIGPIAVHWYGILIVLGILAAAYLSTFVAKLWGEDPDFVWDMLVLCIFLGVVGARLYHVLTPTPSMGVDQWYYFRNPLKIFATWEGGLGIYGAVAGGALGLYIAARRKKKDIVRWLDITTPGLILAQGIGRWGNFINQELYGKPTDLPWGIFIDQNHRLPGYEAFERFHPTFLYESMWNVATCAVLVYLTWRYHDKLASGIIAALYFISYSFIRFVLEFIRLDSASIGSLAIAQYVALVIIVAATGFIIWRIKTYKKPAEQSDEQNVDAAPAE
ncbi:MAG: prolipoprotein diacylglyceryl transferase [Anaerolineae bacterium]|nr:prolipoprotein diacylglyceryl transferase [Anaerolineae bacterium]